MRAGPRRTGAGGVTVSPEITMADAITALVAEKRAVGYKYAAEEQVLARFAAFCCAEFPGLDAPSQASVEAWVAAARQRGVKPATLQALAAPVRELARWLRRRGVPAYVLARRRAAQARPLRPAHLHRRRNWRRLFTQTDRCHYCSAVPFRHLVMPVLFRTIYACGLRASEARLLRVADVDLDTGVLQIRAAKGDKDRQTPAQRAASCPPRRLPRPCRRAQWRGVVLPRHGRPSADPRERRQEFPSISLAGPHLPRGPRATARVCMTCAILSRSTICVGGLRAAMTSARCCRSCRPTWATPHLRTPPTTSG